MRSAAHNVIRVEPCKAVDAALQGSIAVMGNLDGVHLGHQCLINAAVELKGEAFPHRLTAIIFDPHPRTVFGADTRPFLLTTIEHRTSLLCQYGIDHVFVLPFSKDMAALSPEEFVSEILLKTLGVKTVVVGEEFQFGRGRAGNAQTLVTLGATHSIDVAVVTPALNADAGEKYSSSQARAALRAGYPEEAARVLGRPWSLQGNVERGKQLGRTLHFPTANVSIGDLVAPKKGVYAVSLTLAGRKYTGVANFGERPTVNGEGVLLEVHIFDFDADIYGQEIEIYIHYFLREEKKFDNLDALKRQISEDCHNARQALKAG